jgi:hypothetical protein
LDSSDFNVFVQGFSPEIKRLVEHARALVLEVLPDINEFVDPPSRIVAYGFSQKYSHLVCAIAPFKSHINLMIGVGARMEDPHGLLLGTGKKARHVRINSITDIQRPGIRELLLCASQLVISGITTG